MNDVQYRIEKVGEYFREMQVKQVDDTSVIYVVVNLPQRWIIDDEIPEKYDVNVINGQDPGEYWFCADISTGFDKVFDAIDHCIGVNKDAMERAKIFQEKINELKEIFGDGTRTVSELKTITFTFPPQKKSMRSTTPRQPKTYKAPSKPAEKKIDTEENEK